MIHSNRVTGIITTKKHTELDYIIDYVSLNKGFDISDKLPVFLTIKDFNIFHDPSFKAYDIMSSWWQYDKLPIILVDTINDLDELPKGHRELFEHSYIFID